MLCFQNTVSLECLSSSAVLALSVPSTYTVEVCLQARESMEVWAGLEKCLVLWRSGPLSVKDVKNNIV